MSRNLEPSKKSRYKVWLNQAKFDIEIASISLDSRYYEWACYQATQAVEKSLKAIIVHSGYRPPRTHKLGILVSMCNHVNKNFINVKLNFRKIEAYTFISRYPFILPGDNLTPHEAIDYKDATNCYELAKTFLDTIESVLEGKGQKEGDKEIPMHEDQFSESEIENKINEVIGQLKDAKDFDVQKIILFGGFAREKTQPKTSTMDLLIVAKTELPFIDRLQFVRDLTHGTNPIIEPIVYTPEEFEFMVNDEGEGFLESAIEEGRVVFEKNK